MLRSRGSSPGLQGGYQLLSSPKLRKRIKIDRQSAEMLVKRGMRYLFRSRSGIIILLIAVSSVIAFAVSFIHSTSDLTSLENEPFSPNEPDLHISEGFRLQNRPKPVRLNKDGRLVTEEEEDDATQICLVPKLSIHSDSNKFAFHPMPPLVCSGSQLFYLENSILRLNYSVLQGRELDRCEYRGIEWMTDAFFSYTDVLTRTSQFEIKIKHDYMRVECYLKKDKKIPARGISRRLLTANNAPALNFEDVHSSIKLSKDKSRHNLKVTVEKPLESTSAKAMYQVEKIVLPPMPQTGESGKAESAQPKDPLNDYINKQDIADSYYYAADFPDFDQFLAQVIEQEEVLERKKELKPPATVSGLNILMLAFDSMSHLSYQRKLPKLYNYVKTVLKATVLNAYNIVGDATTAAIIPIMTGKTEMELPEVRRNMPGSTYVDIYPLIWNKYEQSGYVTMFAEDEPEIGTFSLRYNGFEQIPTDHYMRPFWQAVKESTLGAESVKHCIGSNPKHMYMLNYTKEFMMSYHGVPKFAFTFFGDLSHEDNNPAEYADQDTVNMLEDLRRSGVLEDTLVIVMADHGARYSEVRNTVQGKLEERLPMMSLAFPEKFKAKYSKNIKQLEKNANKLTTPFDLHETLQDVLKTPRLKEKQSPRNRGLSLLREIPINRTCASSGIPMHWCTCLHWKKQDVNMTIIQKVSGLVVQYINKLIYNQLDLCHPLELSNVEDARIIMPNEEVLRFQKTYAGDLRQAYFSEDIHFDVQFYQVIIKTSPNNAFYEATIQHNLIENEFLLTPDISRINLYGSQADCVTKKFPDLRKYCFCRSPPVEDKVKQNSTSSSH